MILFHNRVVQNTPKYLDVKSIQNLFMVLRSKTTKIIIYVILKISHILKLCFQEKVSG